MKKIRIVCNITIVLCVALGIFLNYQGPNVPKSTLMYYTVQSNILIALVCAVISIYDLFGKTVPKLVYLIKYISTIAIVITGVVFNLILVPQLAEHYGSVARAYGVASTLLHVVTPVLALLSYLFFDRSPFKRKFDLYGVIVPLMYFALIIGLSTIKDLYLFDTLDGEPTKFPYFFLNYIDNGWFTLSADINELGTFYWIVIMVVFVIIISVIIRFVQRMISRTSFYQRYLKSLP